MLAEVVAVEEGLRHLVGLVLEGEGAVGHARDGLEDDGVVRGVVRGAAPGEGRVAGDEAGGNGEGIDGGFVAMGAEALDDGEAGLVDVAAADGLVGEWSGDGDGAVEVVGVRGAERRDGEAGLREAGGELGVRVHDGADGGELAVEQRVGVEVGGGTEVAFDDLAVEVGDDHVRWA